MMRGIIKKVHEKTKEREAKQRSVQRQREQLQNARMAGITGKQAAQPAEQTILESVEARPETKKVHLSETNSIFDQDVVEQDTNQHFGFDSKLVSIPQTSEDSYLENEQQSIDDHIEAKQLGCDLSALYSHKKPTSILGSCQREIVNRIMRLQNENKQREGKYRNIQMARIQ